MGFNGSGKSTILKLTARIYDATEGTIRINGCDVRNLKLDDLRRSIAVLFQDYSLFPVSVRLPMAVPTNPSGQAMHRSKTTLGLVILIMRPIWTS